MADSEEMRNLILHAADRLASEMAAHQPTFINAVRTAGYNETPSITKAVLSFTAALSLAESTLRMVAACMGVEAEPAPAVSTSDVVIAPPADAGPRRTRRTEAP